MSDKLIVLKEPWTESLKRDAASVVAAFVIAIPGWLMGSSLLTLIGGVMFLLVAFNRAAGLRKKYERTPEQALKEIQAMLNKP